ncbi:AMP-binding protein (plasmid) [Nocardioides sp. R1-1]|uniref:AMP-binding protein n=1 Tax=Nocardioides sp. R1-1 TaxID=3383502 RepID=UPI0038D0203C
MTVTSALRSLPGLDRSTRRTPNLAAALQQTARRTPHRPAVVFRDLRWTWGELDRRVDALAAALRGAGVAPGQVVLTHSPNCPDLLTVMYAVWRAGAVWAPTNYRLDPDDVAGLARHTQPVLFVCHRDYADHAAALAGVPVWWLGDDPSRHAGPADVEQLIEAHADQRPERYDPRCDDPAWLFFTSGSSGSPKAAVLTHDQMQFVVTNHLADLMPDLRAEDGTLVVAPLSHGAGIHVTMHVARGARIVLLPDRRLDPAVAWSLVEKERVSTMFTVPTILNRLAQHPAAAAFDRSSLRYVIYAGAPITAKDLARDLEALGPVLVQYYGLGEVTGNITVWPPWMHCAPEPGSSPTAGYERTGMQVSIQDSAGNEVDDGERGEICVCGPAVFAGYLNNDEANQKAFRAGWFRTGDIGYMDETGMLFITGRDSEMYISGGSNIDPREVEEKVLKHPDIEQVAVVGVPDAEWGEVGYAVCVLRRGAASTVPDLVEWCALNMPRYKAPRRVIVVSELPTSGYGKVTKVLLKQLLEELGEWPTPVSAP